jgi:hypothetical protein
MKIIPEAKRAPNHPNPPFKEKEKGGEGGSKAWWPMECSKLGGHWNVPSLVTIGMFQAWWPLKGSKLGGHWKVKEKPFSPLPFSPNNFTYTLNFFPLTSRFYFTMVLSRYSRLSFLFFNL